MAFASRLNLPVIALGFIIAVAYRSDKADHLILLPEPMQTNLPLLRVERLQGANFGPVSLTLCAGECVAVQGPSGAGKTLLLRALADMDPARGGVWLAGVPRYEVPAPDWRRQVALLPAESHWWADTVREHFTAAPREDLGALGFDNDVLNWPVSRLSSGERQRLAIVRLLAIKPRVLLLDEPTANLDADNARRAEVLIKTYVDRNHSAALWVTHDKRQSLRIARRVIGLANGCVIREFAA
jgi:putative ABC transport system ATP-binding protein